MSSLCMGVFTSPPLKIRAGRSLSFVIVLADWLFLSLVQQKKKNNPQPKSEFIFSVHPDSDLLAKRFFYWFGRPGVFPSVWMCKHTCVHVRKNKVHFSVCWCFFHCVLFYVWVVGCATCSITSKASFFKDTFSTFFFFYFIDDNVLFCFFPIAASSTLSVWILVPCHSNGHRIREHCFGGFIFSSELFILNISGDTATVLCKQLSSSLRTPVMTQN